MQATTGRAGPTRARTHTLSHPRPRTHNLTLIDIQPFRILYTDWAVLCMHVMRSPLAQERQAGEAAPEWG